MKKRFSIACILLGALILIIACAMLFYLMQDSAEQALVESAPALPAVGDSVSVPENTDPPRAEDSQETILPGEADVSEPLLPVEQHHPQIQQILLYHNVDPTDTKAKNAFLLLTVDRCSKRLTLTALPPESYLQVRGTQSLYWDQLQAAYIHGGLNRLINTLNAPENYNLDVSHAIGMDLSQLSAFIDLLDGLTLPLTQEDAFYINWTYAGLPADASKASRFDQLDKQGKMALLEKDGAYLLNGQQVLCYLQGNDETSTSSGEAIFARMERQQAVLVSLYETILSSIDLSQLVSLVQDVQSHTTSTLSREELIDLGAFLISNKLPVTTLCIPRAESCLYTEEPIDGTGNVFATLRFQVEQEREILFQSLYPTGWGNAAK